MALQVRGNDILSHGEFAQLVRGLDDAAPTAMLAAWFAGEEIEPSELHQALDIDCRIATRTPRARALIDAALRRLEQFHPMEATA
jgi:hypothetical protein